MTVIIYDMDGEIINAGFQSDLVCSEAINYARNIAKISKHSVVVEDGPAEECYRVTPGGHIWKKPKGWIPEWDREDVFFE